MLELPKWGVTMRKAQHEPLISFETYTRIQERLNGKVRAPVRLDVNQAFALRGFICCSDCDHPMTANYSKGSKGKHYPYYLCRQAGCPSNSKSISRDKVEAAFGELLRSLAPARELFDLAAAIFRDLWDDQASKAKERKKAMAKELTEIDRKVAQVVDRIVDAESKTVIGALEKRLDEMEQRKLLLAENIAKCGTPVRDYDESFRTSMEFLASPWILWESDSLEDKRAAVKLTFSDQLKYDRKEGFRTPKISLPFKALREIYDCNEVMAHPTGFEPVASAFGGQKIHGLMFTLCHENSPLPAELGIFDLVIVDEASQSTLSALPALFRARQILVVGDDKQVSPDNVGLNMDHANMLAQRHLSRQVPLFVGPMRQESSLYDLASVIFGADRFMLCEHFRCAAPIIEFSKQQFYDGKLRPLRLSKASERLDPVLVDVLVTDGYRKGGGNTNPPEADFIIAELLRLPSGSPVATKTTSCRILSS